MSGDPAAQDPWGWRLEGHHISLHYTSVNGHISFTPSFLGSNPGHVLIDVPQKGKRVLGQEEDMGYELLNSFNADQKKRVLLAEKSPYEIFSTNQRRVTGLDKMEGLTMKEMTVAQKQLFKNLIALYLSLIHIFQDIGLGDVHYRIADDAPVARFVGKSRKIVEGNFGLRNR